MARDPIAMPLLEVAPEPAELAQRRFLNRALSWIDFDRRVLELAGDPELPLLERVRYCGIASSNLDEFFAVRMAELYDHVDAGERGVRLLVEDVLLHFLPYVVGLGDVAAACAFRVTRDADISVASDAD